MIIYLLVTSPTAHTQFSRHKTRRYMQQWGVTQLAFYLLKVNNENSWTICEICSIVTIKTSERRHWRHSGVFIEQISHAVLVFHCCLWTSKCVSCKTRNHPQTIQTTHKPPTNQSNDPQTSQNSINHPLISQKSHHSFPEDIFYD